MQPLVVSVSEAAKALNLGRTSIYQLINEGRLEAVKLGSRRLIKLASIHQLIEQAK